MATKQDNLWFSILPSENNILVRVHVCAPFNQKPENLEKLFSLLRQNGEISTLKEEFPQDSRVIWVLQKVLSLGAIKPEGLSGIHWNSDNGHGIHIVISI